jgi:RecA-family ATPase
MTSFKAVTMADLEKKEFAERPYLMRPWFYEGSLAMLFARRGLGKSMLAIAITQTITSGSHFLGWIPNTGSVLYLDWESDEQWFKSDFDRLNRSASFPSNPELVKFFCVDHMGATVWNLADPKYQKAAAELAKNSSLVVIDNLTRAVKPLAREDWKTSFARFVDWMFSLRTAGKSILVLHHAGKSGEQRGFSDIEDPFEVILKLQHPEGWTEDMHTQYELTFEKGRHLSPKAKRPLFIEAIEDEESNSIKWLFRSLWEQQQQQEQNKLNSAKKGKGTQDELF